MADIDVADAAGIRALYARYAHAIDSGDGETWADCYTADGTYWSSTFGTRSGRDALRTFAVAHYREWHEQGISTQHWINQSLFEPMSWGVSARTYVLLMGARETGPPAAMLQTVYHDEVVRDGGGWRLRRRASHAQCRLVLPAVHQTVDS